MKGPPDGGWGWMCVMGKLYCYLCVLGTPTAFGVIYIDLIDYFNTTREVAAWIGSLSVGMTLLTGPLSSVLIERFGIRKITAAGSLLAFSGCFISWFANGIPYLYVSYGVIMGIGNGLTLVPCILIVVEYFEKKLGLANAIGSTGEGLGTLILPPLFTYLLEEYGWRGTFLLLSGILLNGLVSAVIFMPPQFLKSSTNSGSSNRRKVTFCTNVLIFSRNSCVVLYMIGTGLAFLGFLVPFVHIPDLAVQNGISKYDAAYLVSVMGVTNIVGRLVFGWISDFECVNVIFLQAASLMVCGVVTIVSPHLTEFYALAVYSVIFGTFIGVFSSLIPVAERLLVGLDQTGDFLGLSLFLTGIMSLVSSPLAGWLFDTTKTYEASFYVTGCVFFLSGVIIMVVMVLHRRQKRQTGENIEVRVPTVAKTHINTQNDNQDFHTFEYTYM